MLNTIIYFTEKYPAFIKRAVVKNNRITAWTWSSPGKVVSMWKKITNYPLRLVPITPLEGGLTQEKWNKIWDNATEITKKVRYYKLEA